MSTEYARALMGSAPESVHPQSHDVSGAEDNGDSNLIAVTTSGPSLATLYKRGQERQLIPAISSGSDYN